MPDVHVFWQSRGHISIIAMLVPPPSEHSGEGCEEIWMSPGPGLASDLALWMGPLQYLLTSLIFR
uniref:Uncharacterized protein n=1 Tax=Nomascus leucogenys TaxID=61853 RepID=A0A2I3HT47_NOMLE